MSVYMCPFCGRQYSARACKPLIPTHVFVTSGLRHMSAAALESGAAEEEMECPGSGQTPRNAESDRRPLWKDGGCP